jgi:hypothetical protein
VIQGDVVLCCALMRVQLGGVGRGAWLLVVVVAGSIYLRVYLVFRYDGIVLVKTLQSVHRPCACEERSPLAGERLRVDFHARKGVELVCAEPVALLGVRAAVDVEGPFTTRRGRHEREQGFRNCYKHSERENRLFITV